MDAEPHPDHDPHRERRMRLLIERLPGRLQAAIHWLREPRRRVIRLVAGIAFILGSLLSVLPVFGIWMLPLGVLLIADDIPPLRRWTGRRLEWIERRRPHWMGLPR